MWQLPKAWMLTWMALRADVVSEHHGDGVFFLPPGPARPLVRSPVAAIAIALEATDSQRACSLAPLSRLRSHSTLPSAFGVCYRLQDLCFELLLTCFGRKYRQNWCRRSSEQLPPSPVALVRTSCSLCIWFLIFGIFCILSDTVRDLSFQSCSRCDVVERRARVSVSIFLVSREVLFSLGVCVLVPHYADLFDSLFSSEYGIHHIFATKFGSSVTTSLLTWLTKAPYLVEVFFFSCSWYVLILYTWIIFSSRQTRCIIL